MVLNDMCINKPTTDDQLSVTLAAIKSMESLVELTEDHLSMYYGVDIWIYSAVNCGGWRVALKLGWLLFARTKTSSSIFSTVLSKILGSL